jgi:holliday junction DNA helicase RuvA
MLEYIKGKLTELTPTYLVIENNGIGYFVNVSISTASELKPGQECQLYIHEIIREDTHTLYAFVSKQEREMFRLLITVNGVGPNTARLIISSIPWNKLITVISSNNVDALKNVKGIGLKTAQRIVIDLKDKISDTGTVSDEIFSVQNNTLAKDSLSALTMLGFSKSAVQKVVNKIIRDNSNNQALTVEDVVKQALNYL